MRLPWTSLLSTSNSRLWPNYWKKDNLTEIYCFLLMHWYLNCLISIFQRTCFSSNFLTRLFSRWEQGKAVWRSKRVGEQSYRICIPRHESITGMASDIMFFITTCDPQLLQKVKWVDGCWVGWGERVDVLTHSIRIDLLILFSYYLSIAR